MQPVPVDLSDVDDAVALARGAHELLAGLVAGGAALGWIDPPSPDEVSGLMGDVVAAARVGDAAIRGVYVDDRLAGLGYWRRYARPTHRPHADLEKLAVAPTAQGRGVGRRLTEALIADARAARIEVLTLDMRGDNEAAWSLYRSLGFEEYGRLARFVAVGHRRYDKVFLALDLRVR
jgi:ribosomal protein S18 acetylase RimI-like enzyme